MFTLEAWPELRFLEQLRNGTLTEQYACMAPQAQFVNIASCHQEIRI